MTDPRHSEHGSRLPLYITGRHPCSYLPGLAARTLFADPTATMDGPLYESLLAQGFRRSGTHVYRPACEFCTRCVSVRVPVDAFAPNRSQRRNALRNGSDVTLIERPAVFDPEHSALYETYVRSRHPEGSMADEASPDSYRDFLIIPWGGETLLMELRLNGRLVGAAVTDRLPGALSAVYTYFDPEFAERAPGTFAVLSQIALARRLGLKYLYLGYWVEECRKMSYKDAYRPLQGWINGRWKEFGRGKRIA